MGLPADLLNQFWSKYDGSEQFWKEAAAEIAAGRHPTPLAIRKALRSRKPVPDWAADYIAGRLTGPGGGTVAFGRGEQPWSTIGLTFKEARLCKRSEFAKMLRRSGHARDAWWIDHYRKLCEDPKYVTEYERKYSRKYPGRLPPEKTPLARAKAQVAWEFHMSTHTADKHRNPR